MAVSFFAGLWPTGTPAASSAYEYQHAGSVSGSGTIAGTRGQVSFSITAKLDNSGSTGNCSVNEPGTKTKIKCLGVTSLTFGPLANGCQSAVMEGPATINGTSTTYRIEVVDCGEPGVGSDTFSIDADGFHRSGSLTSGNIQVRSTQ